MTCGGSKMRGDVCMWIASTAKLHVILYISSPALLRVKVGLDTTQCIIPLMKLR